MKNEFLKNIIESIKKNSSKQIKNINNPKKAISFIAFIIDIEQVKYELLKKNDIEMLNEINDIENKYLKTLEKKLNKNFNLSFNENQKKLIWQQISVIKKYLKINNEIIANNIEIYNFYFDKLKEGNEYNKSGKKNIVKNNLVKIRA